MAEVGREVGRRLQATRDDAVFLIPTARLRQLCDRGRAVLRSRSPTPPSSRHSAKRRRRNIRIVERPLDINDPAFATEAARTLIGLIQAARRSALTVAIRYSREQCLARLRAEIAAGRSLLMTGAGNGIAAKFIERGGADLIGVYNTGYFRMQGYGSLAGMLPILDSNELVFRIAEREVLPQVRSTPGDRRRQRRRSAPRHGALPEVAPRHRHLRASTIFRPSPGSTAISGDPSKRPASATSTRSACSGWRATSTC